MLNTKNCLKISFQGEVGFIICETNSSYEQIINQVITRFNIPESQRAGLVLTNGQGYVFEQQLLEYFLLLFPCPELTFYLRIDWQKLRRAVIAGSSKRRRVSEQTTEIASGDEMEDYVAVPVHRQNCFLGALPNSGAPLRRQNGLLQLQQQQQPAPLRVLRQLPSMSAVNPPAKRMRLQLCNKSRHSAVATAAPHLATASRSIRI